MCAMNVESHSPYRAIAQSSSGCVDAEQLVVSHRASTYGWKIQGRGDAEMGRRGERIQTGTEPRLNSSH